MEYTSCTNLFSAYVFILPQARAITQKGQAAVQISFLRSLVLRNGGQINNANTTSKLIKLVANEKICIKIAAKSNLSRTDIDCRLTQYSSKQKNIGSNNLCFSPFKRKDGEDKTKAEDVINLDYHWIVDSIYSQDIRPLEVYKLEK